MQEEEEGPPLESSCIKCMSLAVPHTTCVSLLQAETTGTIGFPSLLSHLASSELIHPIHVLPSLMTGLSPRLRRAYTGLQTQLSCDIHLLNLRTLETTSQSTRAALILHRHGIDCGFPTYGVTCQCSNGRVRLVSIG